MNVMFFVMKGYLDRPDDAPCWKDIVEFINGDVLYERDNGFLAIVSVPETVDLQEVQNVLDEIYPYIKVHRISTRPAFSPAIVAQHGLVELVFEKGGEGAISRNCF